MTYSFGGFSKGLLLQELLLLTVVGPGSNQGYNGNSNENTETFDPSMGEVVSIGKRHINHNLDNGADDQKLEHEIVEGLVKQNAEASPRWWRLKVGTESGFTVMQTVRGSTSGGIKVQFVEDRFNATEVAFNVFDIIDVLSLTVLFDNSTKLLSGDLIFRGSCSRSIIIFSHRFMFSFFK